MTIRRSFIIDTCDPEATLKITELAIPNTCELALSYHGQVIPVRLTKKQFEALASLASYSSYAKYSIEWAAPPEQPELDLPEPAEDQPL